MNPPAPLTRFTLFPCLPAELRLKIYEHILSLSFLNVDSDAKRILKISFSASLNRYVSNIPPPICLSLCPESRALTLKSWEYLSLGPSSYRPFPTSKEPVTDPLIPIYYPTTTLYISALHPLLATFLPDFLYHLSNSSSRHHIQSLAIDLSVWSELREHGFVGVLAGMKGLREVCIVVEFGRKFEGDLGFLEMPEWRRDLKWLADRAENAVEQHRLRGQVVRVDKGKDEVVKPRVRVKCVILTKGGEQA